MFLLKPNIPKMKRQKNLNALLKVLNHKDNSFRMQAKQAISEIIDSQINDPQTRKVIISALGNKDSMIYSPIVDIMITRVDHYLEFLSEAIQKGKREVRWRCAEIFGRTKCINAIKYLRFVALEDVDSNVQDTAVWALSQIGTEDATRIIEECKKLRTKKIENSFKNTAVGHDGKAESPSQDEYYDSGDMPREELVQKADQLLKAMGGPQFATLYFIFTCAKCGARIRFTEPNKIYEYGECEKCGYSTPITKGSFMLIGDRDRLRMLKKR